MPLPGPPVNTRLFHADRATATPASRRASSARMTAIAPASCSLTASRPGSWPGRPCPARPGPVPGRSRRQSSPLATVGRMISKVIIVSRCGELLADHLPDRYPSAGVLTPQSRLDPAYRNQAEEAKAVWYELFVAPEPRPRTRGNRTRQTRAVAPGFSDSWCRRLRPKYLRGNCSTSFLWIRMKSPLSLYLRRSLPKCRPLK